jgi:hypothetical protein
MGWYVTCAVHGEAFAPLERGPSCGARERGKLARVGVGHSFEIFEEKLQRPEMIAHHTRVSRTLYAHENK